MLGLYAGSNLFDAAPDLPAERADVPGLAREAPAKLARDAGADLVYVRLAQVRIDHECRRRRADRELIGVRAHRLEGRRRNDGSTAVESGVQIRERHAGRQTGVADGRVLGDPER